MIDEEPRPLRSIAEILAGLDQLGAELRDATPMVKAIYIKQGRELIANFRTFVAELERQYVADFNAGKVAKKETFEGAGTFEVKKSTTRKAWDHDGMWAVVVARALDERTVDEETGEFEREADVVARVLRDCATPSWKVTGLRAHGINDATIEEYCQVEYGDEGLMIL